MSGNRLRLRGDLKSSFETGDRPSGEDFAALIDSVINQEEDGVFAVDGKVGIGTNVPEATLNVNGGTGALKQSILSSDGSYSVFRVAHPEEGVAALGPNEQQELKIGHFRADGSYFNTNVRINSEGDTAIGDKVPEAKLHVQGDLKVDEKITLGDCELIFHQGRLILFYNGVQYNVKLEKARSTKTPGTGVKTSSNGTLYFLVIMSLLISLAAVYTVLYLNYYEL
jgi:hypothetical protein